MSAGGVAKTDAIRSVLRGRAVTGVVTDADVTRRLLAQEPRLLTLNTSRRKRPLPALGGTGNPGPTIRRHRNPERE
jgi:hypothetical protein